MPFLVIRYFVRSEEVAFINVLRATNCEPTFYVNYALQLNDV